MNPTDFGLDYTGGINAPNGDDIGLPAIADDAGTNLIYQRGTHTIARGKTGAPLVDANDVTLYDTSSLAATYYRFDTVDATPFALPPFSITTEGVTTVHVELHALADPAVAAVHLWKRADFRMCVVQDPFLSAQIGTTSDEQTPQDGIGVGGLSFSTDFLDGTLTLTITGRAATLIHWAVKIRQETTQFGV